MLLGVLGGLLLRPNPVGGLWLLRVQLLDWSQLKSQGLLVNAGTETAPMPMLFLLYNYAPFLILWLLAGIAGVLTLRHKDAWAEFPASLKIPALSTFLLSLLFYLVMTLTAKRASDQWVVFAGVFVATFFSSLEVWSRLPGQQALRRTLLRQGRVLTATMALIFAGIAVFTLTINTTAQQRSTDTPYRLKDAAGWLAQNTQPGDIVFHSFWSMFPELFFWNQHNYFIGGMDPVFQYRYNPELYWKMTYLELNRGAGKTSGKPPQFVEGTLQMPEPQEETSVVLQRDFNARYLIVIPPLNPDLYQYARTAPGFTLRYEQGNVAIFAL